ncbi:alpha/beta hydrolase [Marivirga sp. S37H4]|uniref:Proline iminopeptidase n=1 Tax=Marivirga aurantiaca TaxID=2802615 RepID=A0A934X1Y0_9BACT|nr:alpha/beta hydrolase [Marivirga aurantiaca]MBK6266976.1 alpha/beta hydrolase [Marivirga aurantiaca]
MRKISLSILFIFLFSFSAISQSKSINEEKYISIGGIEQWVTIKGEDIEKPVILFLHGGPGSVMSPYHNIYSGWEKDFILVNWDQRGAGRTFGRNAPTGVNEDYWIENPLSVEQMSTDGIELSKYLIKYLGKEKITLIGTSWGSILGTTMALKRPDLFYAYIGHSQLVNFTENIKYAYQKVYAMAQNADDKESVEKLESLASPPYTDAKSTGQLLRIIKKYERKNSVPAPESWWVLASGYDNETDANNRYNGDDYSFINFAGHKKIGIEAMSATVDFMKDGLNFKIPVYLVQGEEDILTSKEITKAYFDAISAPEKEYFLLPEAAHGHNQSVVDMQYHVLKKYVSPLIK